MALWMRQAHVNKPEKKDNKDSQAKQERPKQQTRRLDNLRIYKSLKIQTKSLGTRTEHHFVTNDLSSTGAFILCENASKQPFLLNSTLLECKLEIFDEQQKPFWISFLAKLARFVEETNQEHKGFGIRIVQISQDSKYYLEQYIDHNGKLENEEDFKNAANF